MNVPGRRGVVVVAVLVVAAGCGTSARTRAKYASICMNDAAPPNAYVPGCMKAATESPDMAERWRTHACATSYGAFNNPPDGMGDADCVAAAIAQLQEVRGLANDRVKAEDALYGACKHGGESGCQETLRTYESSVEAARRDNV